MQGIVLTGPLTAAVGLAAMSSASAAAVNDASIGRLCQA
jgi:hypothetical protein